MIGNTTDKINFLNKLLLTNRQVSRLRKAFAYNSSAKIKLSKIQISKIMQSSGVTQNLLNPLTDKNPALNNSGGDIEISPKKAAKIILNKG